MSACMLMVVVEKDFLNKTQCKQGKMDILDYIKITNFYSSKGNMKGIK